MKVYYVDYIIDGEEKTKRLRAVSAGQAFSKIKEEFPEAKLVRAYQQGGALGGWGFTEYQPPSEAKVTPLPVEKTEQQKLL